MGSCSSLHCGSGRRTAVYRLYDRNQRLLYVGIAHDTKKRWREHARDKDWWNQVHWKTAVWHESRLGAAIEEYCAFRFENPIHNKSRDYDYRLGWESGRSPGHHEPRPWRLGLLASAMQHRGGGWAWGDAAPHYAAVIASDQEGVDPDCVRIRFPQIAKLGYWTCGPLTRPGSKDEIYGIAARILAEDYGLGAGTFTLSLHDPDSCPDPELEDWVAPAPPRVEVVGLPWWRRRGKKVDGLRIAVAVLEIDIFVLLGIGVTTAFHLAHCTHSDGLLAVFGLGAASRTAARWLWRPLRVHRRSGAPALEQPPSALRN